MSPCFPDAQSIDSLVIPHSGLIPQVMSPLVPLIPQTTITMNTTLGDIAQAMIMTPTPVRVARAPLLLLPHSLVTTTLYRHLLVKTMRPRIAALAGKLMYPGNLATSTGKID